MLQTLVDPLEGPLAGTPTLWEAARLGDFATVNRLLTDSDIDSDIEQLGGRGLTPLQIAAYKGFDDIVALLLEHGAEMFVTTPEGVTLLHFAAGSSWQGGRGDGLTTQKLLKVAVADKRLLRHNADPSIRDVACQTPLHYTACKCNVQLSKLLVRYMTKESINTTDENGDTALHFAAGRGLHTPRASFSPVVGRMDLVGLFINAGVQLDTLNNAGETPYDVAVARHRTALADTLKSETLRREVLDAFLKGLHTRRGIRRLREAVVDPGVVQMITGEL
ncbi:ankyrin repeat-containing domain protein [Baffinella frigidus]|nr:ankyrin repeat-containing domain protein [Cryptophyta sp. CCMP2293]